MTRIQYLRSERDWSRRELAQKAGVSDTVIHRLEKGKGYGGTGIKQFYRIAKALGVGLMDVIDVEMIERELPPAE